MSELIKAVNLKKYFNTPGGFLHAVDNINFAIEQGKTLGVVGESGCGKSTLGRVLLGLVDATDGQVFFDGKEITHLSGKARREMAKQMQIIFQDPFSSLNPRLCVEELIADPLKTFHICKSKDEMEKRVFSLMNQVGLDQRFASSYPHELDGGRRQRVGIARSLALGPRFVVCDEPVSALDVSIQAQILNLLQDLQKEEGLTYLFITHDLSVVRHISDDILVMYTGTMVEKSPTKELFSLPLHPYTKGLLSAIPVPSIDHPRKRIIMQGEIVSPVDPKSGCRFAQRCPYATDVCKRRDPVFEEVRDNHYVACHRVKEVNNL